MAPARVIRAVVGIETGRSAWPLPAAEVVRDMVARLPALATDEAVAQAAAELGRIVPLLAKIGPLMPIVAPVVRVAEEARRWGADCASPRRFGNARVSIQRAALTEHKRGITAICNLSQSRIGRDISTGTPIWAFIARNPTAPSAC